MPRPQGGRPRREGACYLLVQRVPGGARPDPGPGRRGRPLAAAALQEVHARRAAALLALEIEEHILVESEPLLVPATRVGCLLAQEAAFGALLAGQEGQVQGVPLVVAHALLHGEGAGGSPVPRSHLQAGSPRGPPAAVRSGRRAPPCLTQGAGHPAGLRGAAPRGSEGALGCGQGRFSAATAALLAERSPGSPRRPRGKVAPRGRPGPPPLRPKLREPEPRGGAGAARRAAARGGLSSGNSLRETEGKTSRGRSAVIGLETDLKGKVGAAAVTAAPLTPARASTLARQPGRLPPLLPRRGGAESRAVRARGGSAHPLTRAPARTDQYIHSHAHRCTLAQHPQSQHSARTSTVLTRRSHSCKQEYTYTQIVTNSVTLTYKHTQYLHTQDLHSYMQIQPQCVLHTKMQSHIVAHYTGNYTRAHTYMLTQTHTLTDTKHARKHIPKLTHTRHIHVHLTYTLKPITQKYTHTYTFMLLNSQ